MLGSFPIKDEEAKEKAEAMRANGTDETPPKQYPQPLFDANDNAQLRLAFEFVQFTDRHVFLTGKAGTGKTHFLHTLKSLSPKRMIVVAPTGVAAINAGGVTIHSFFQLPFGPLLPKTEMNGEPPTGHYRFNRHKIDIIRSLDLLVIDEISMVRADLLDGIDAVLRRYRPGDRPFGGAQLLMIGDLQQLAPVVKDDDWEILSPYYETMFFFSSRALARTRFVPIELKHIYRQSDPGFIDLLAKVRENRMTQEDLRTLNRRFDPILAAEAPEGTITLTTHNFQARKINESRLAALPGREQRFQARVEGDFPDYAFPTDADLVLKPGAQVMFVKNDASLEKRYFNGKIGRLTGLGREELTVRCPGEAEPIVVEPVEWKNVKYGLNETTKEIEETEAGRFIQFPLKLAWAITIHKSQGLTFDRAVIDARAAFAEGQVYVALSRCRSLEGLVLSSPIEDRSIKSNAVIGEFTREIEAHAPDENQLHAAKREYQEVLLDELFDFSSLLRRLLFCLKIAAEHQAVLTGLGPDFFRSLVASVKTDITTVADKFLAQRRRIVDQVPDLEQSSLLQERVGKAAVYFAEKIETQVSRPLEGVSPETDNREVRRIIQKALSLAGREAAQKLFCLQACRSGIRFADYLPVRAQALFQEPAGKPDRSKRTETSPVDPGTIPHPDLYRTLKEWRAARAKELNQPAFCVLHNNVLVEICRLLPAQEATLRTIKGLKGKKGQTLGKELLELVAQYRSKPPLPDMEPGSDRAGIPSAKPPKEKGTSQEETLRIFLEGKTMAEVAAARGLALSTVEGHLTHFVGTGELALDRLVGTDKAARIAAYFACTPLAGLTAAKEALGDVSYGELQFVLKDLARRGKHPTDPDEPSR